MREELSQRLGLSEARVQVSDIVCRFYPQWKPGWFIFFQVIEVIRV